MRPERALRAVLAALLALAWAGVAGAQAQGLRITPQLQTSLTWTDNIDTVARGAESAWVAEVSPGISIARDGGRVRGRLDASLRNLVNLSGNGDDNTYLALSGRGMVEAVEDLFFIDLDATISRDNLSAFGGRSRGDTLSASRDNQLRSYGIAPRLELRRGDLAGTLRYEARWLDGHDALASQRLGRWSARLGDPRAFGPFGWGLDYRYSELSYGGSGGGRNLTQEIVRATVFAELTPQLRLRLIGGHESNDYGVRRGESGSIVGGGVDWYPSPRTALSATTEKRIFGRGYDLRLNHRRARSAWELAWSRDIASSIETLASLYDDPVFRQLYDALLTAYPDPAEREQATRELLQALGLGGLSLRDTVVSNRYFLDRRMRAGFSLIGVRNTLTFVLSRSDRERLGSVTLFNPLDDFSVYDRVRETSAGINLAHRLSPRASLNAALVRTHIRGSGLTAGSSRRGLLSVGLNTALGPHTSAGLTYRHQRVSGIGRFTENALIATFLMRF